MARVKKTDSTKAGSGQDKVEWRGYVNHNLSEADKKRFDEWIKDQDVWYNLVPGVMEDYKLSFGYDRKGDSVYAALYCQTPGHPNAGWCLTARSAGDVPLALARLLYIHFACFEQEWPAEYTPDPDRW